MEATKTVFLLSDSFVYVNEDLETFERTDLVECLICEYPNIEFVSYILNPPDPGVTNFEEHMESLLSKCDEIWILEIFFDDYIKHPEIEYAIDNDMPIIRFNDFFNTHCHESIQGGE